MSSSIKAIDEDIDEYQYLCKKYNESMHRLYSEHHDWLLDKWKNNTDLSFLEFLNKKKK